MIGAVILVVWFFTAASQLLLRRRTEREAPERLVVRMWLFPGLTWVALAAMAGVFVLMAKEPDTRVQLLSTGSLTVALALAGYLLQRKRAAAPAGVGKG